MSFVVIANRPWDLDFWLVLIAIYYLAYKRDIPKFCATWVLTQIIWDITFYMAFLSLGVNTIFIGDFQSNNLLYRYLDNFNPYFHKVAEQTIFLITKRCLEEGTLFEMTIYTWTDFFLNFF